MIRFVQRPTGEIFRVLQEVDNGMWLISYDIPAAPFFAASAEAEGLEHIETPLLFLEARQRSLTPAERKRLALIQPCGNGVIEDDAQERWSTDYRAQAVLDLDEFTAIVIHCIVYLNSVRLLSSGKTPSQTWIDAAPALLAVNAEELHHFTLPRAVVKLTRKGIVHNGLTYTPDISAPLHIGSSYEIAYDPSDSSVIFIWEDNHFLQANLSSKFDQFQGLSWSEIQSLKKVQQRDRQAARQSEVAASVAATQAVQSIIQTAGQHHDRIRQGLTGGQISENRSDEIGRLT